MVVGRISAFLGEEVTLDVAQPETEPLVEPELPDARARRPDDDAAASRRRGGGRRPRSRSRSRCSRRWCGSATATARNSATSSARSTTSDRRTRRAVLVLDAVEDAQLYVAAERHRLVGELQQRHPPFPGRARRDGEEHEVGFTASLLDRLGVRITEESRSPLGSYRSSGCRPAPYSWGPADHEVEDHAWSRTCATRAMPPWWWRSPGSARRRWRGLPPLRRRRVRARGAGPPRPGAGRGDRPGGVPPALERPGEVRSRPRLPARLHHGDGPQPRHRRGARRVVAASAGGASRSPPSATRLRRSSARSSISPSPSRSAPRSRA